MSTLGLVVNPAKNPRRSEGSQPIHESEREHSMTTNRATNSDLAAKLAQVADALAAYDHLPTLGSVTVYDRHTIRLSVDYARPEHRDVAAWATAFNAPVVIDLSSSGSLFTVVQLAGMDARLSDFITHRQAYEFGAALGIPVSPGGQVEVSPADLLAALDTDTATDAAGTRF